MVLCYFPGQDIYQTFKAEYQEDNSLGFYVLRLFQKKEILNSPDVIHGQCDIYREPGDICYLRVNYRKQLPNILQKLIVVLILEIVSYLFYRRGELVSKLKQKLWICKNLFLSIPQHFAGPLDLFEFLLGKKLIKLVFGPQYPADSVENL